MGKGGGSSEPQYTKQEVSQSNLPEYARPYYQSLMQRSQGLLTQDYTPYGQERIAGFTPEQKAVQQEVAGLKTPGAYGEATDLARQVSQSAMAGSQYDPTKFSAQTITPQQLQAFQMAAPQMFGSEQAQQYMSPYAQNVIEIQKREALRDAQRTNMLQNLGAARQGTYGASGQILAGLERERATGQNLADIQAKGLQAAYENAQQQFERDRAAQMGAGRENLAAQLGVQSLGAQQSLQAALENQRQNLEAQRLGEQSRQFGSDLGLRGLAQAGGMAQLIGQLGTAEQQATMARLGMQQQTAAQEQALQQQYLDTAYQDFLRQRDYPLEMLQQYSSLLRGVPIQPNTTTTTYAPTPGIGQQLLGAGLGAASIYKTFAGA